MKALLFPPRKYFDKQQQIVESSTKGQVESSKSIDTESNISLDSPHSVTLITAERSYSYSPKSSQLKIQTNDNSTTLETISIRQDLSNLSNLSIQEENDIIIENNKTTSISKKESSRFINIIDRQSSNSALLKFLQLPSSSSSSINDTDHPPLPEFITTHQNFKHLSPIANGSNSNIYKIKLNGKLVVLKVMKDSTNMNKTVMNEFEKEVSIISRLNHKNILNMYGAGQVASQLKSDLQRPLLVLELLNGGTLSTLLKEKRPFQSRPFTEQQYLRIGNEFADALYYLHELVHPDCMLIHRDLKPDNIGFATDGTLKLMDFGACIALKRNSLDRSGNYTLTGSLKYTAPEYAKKFPYNEKVDIYSFGIIMYEVITGCSPFGGIGNESFYEKVMERNYRPSLLFDDQERDIVMSHEIRNLIQCCWHVDASKRPTAKQACDFFVLIAHNNDVRSSKKKGGKNNNNNTTTSSTSSGNTNSNDPCTIS